MMILPGSSIDPNKDRNLKKKKEERYAPAEKVQKCLKVTETYPEKFSVVGTNTWFKKKKLKS